MAQLNDFVSSLEKELTCSICQDLFHEPKTLQPCLHSFCQKCLQGWNETCRNRKKRLTCPTCMTPVQLQDRDVSKLKSSFYLESLKDLLLAMKNKAGKQNQLNLPNCVSCEKHVTLVAFCPQCEGMVCTACKNAHDAVKQLREEHQVKLFAELKQEHVNNYISNQQRCSEKFHEKFKLEYYCKTCKKTICQSCSIKDHSNHKYIQIEVKAEEIKESIHYDLDRVNQQKQRFLKELQFSKENLTRIENEITTAKKEVDDQVQAQIKILQDHQNTMRAALDEMFLKQKRENGEEQREISARIQQLDALNKQGEELPQQNVPHFILESTQFGERCQKLLRNRSILKSKSFLRNLTVRYLPTSPVTQPDFGRIVESLPDPSCCSVMQSLYFGSLIKCEIVTKNSEDQVCYTNQGSIDVNIQDANGSEIENELTESKTGKFFVTFKAENPPPYQIHVSIGGQEIKDSPKTLYGFKSVKSFGDKGKGKLNISLSLTSGLNGDVVIADYFNHRIVIFDADGEYVRHFGTYGKTDGKLCNPFGVVMRDNTILVSDDPSGTGRIQEFDVNGAYLRTMYTAQKQVILRGMCVAGRHIAVCCDHLNYKTQAGIKLLSKQSGQVVREIPTPGKTPWYIAYDNNKYFISYGDQNHVTVYDENLALLYTFGSKGKEDGQFDFLGGFAIHDRLLLVCDGNNHRVQVLTQDGHFITSLGSHGPGTGQMNFPVDVVVTPDRKVLVLQYRGSSVQLWQ